MATGIAGLKSGNHIVPYSQTTKRTKVVDFENASTGNISSDAVATVAFNGAYGYAYADSNDEWRLAGNISMSHGSDTSHTVTITGIKAKNVANFYQGCNLAGGSTASGRAYTTPNQATISVFHASAQTATFLSFDVALEEIPDWADANMEASTDASVWIEPSIVTTKYLATGSSPITATDTDITDIKFTGMVSGQMYRLVCSVSGATLNTGASNYYVFNYKQGSEYLGEITSGLGGTSYANHSTSIDAIFTSDGNDLVASIAVVGTVEVYGSSSRRKTFAQLIKLNNYSGT
jgi:hypothetical protein